MSQHKEGGTMIELLQNTLLYGVVGSVGATLAIFTFNVIRTYIV